MSALCHRLLGEELLIPGAATWWCGEECGLQHVLSHLRKLIVKPAFSGSRLDPVDGRYLSTDERERWAERIKAFPHQFVGQQPLALSTVPVLFGEKFESRQMVLRTFLAAHEESFVVMPGGLTRVSGRSDRMVTSMQQGGGSKDTWVLSAGPVSTFSLLRPSGSRVELSRGGNELPSRVADNLFWIGRYAERAEGVARMLRGVLVRMTDKQGLHEVSELPVLIRALAHLCGGGSGDSEGEQDGHEFVSALIHDPKQPGGLPAIFQALTQIAGRARDRVSTDMWRVLSGSGLSKLPSDASARRAFSAETLESINRTILTLAAFGGLAMDSMTRGEGWRFLDMGRRLERGMNLLTLLRHSLVHPVANEGPLLEAVLEIADSSMTYRRRYLGSLQAAAVFDLLLCDETNPRSLVFQLAALFDDVEHLPHDATYPGRSPEQRIALAIFTSVRLADIDILAQADPHGHRVELDSLLGRLAVDLPTLSDAITQRYLSHLKASRHFAVSNDLKLPYSTTEFA
jgi:uncharacterized alpha-E superfamily protein